MDMKHRSDSSVSPSLSVLFSVLRALLLVALALVTVATLALTAVWRTLFDRTLFVNAAADANYVTTVHESVADKVEAECLYYGIEYDYVKDAVDEAFVSSLSQTYFGNLYDTIYTGESLQPLVVSPAIFDKGLDAFFATLDTAERAEIDTATRDEIAQALADAAQGSIQSFPYADKLSAVNAYTFGHPQGQRLPLAVATAAVIWLILFTLALFFSGKTTRHSLYHTAGTVWCSTALLFVPFLLFLTQDLPEKLAFSGNLKALATTLLNAVLTRMEGIFGAAFAVFTVFLLVMIVLLIVHRYRSYQTPSEDTAE